MGKIIAIGGGEIGRPGYPIETTAIDKEIIRISKKPPRLLFLPTASNDSKEYVKTVEKHFGMASIVELARFIAPITTSKKTENPP